MIELNGILMLPKGDIKSPGQVQLDMKPLHQADRRLGEVRMLRQGTAAELMGSFNESAAIAMDYIAQLKMELITASQRYDHRRATVVLEVLPSKLDDLKAKGIKSNEDVREAVITLDPECTSYKDRIDCLAAVLAMLENKVKSYVRAYNAARSVVDARFGSGAYAPLNSSGNTSDMDSIISMGLGPED